MMRLFRRGLEKLEAIFFAGKRFSPAFDFDKNRAKRFVAA
jgi:hypothetical protein